MAVFMPMTLPLHVEKRAAGIAAIDGGIRLDVIARPVFLEVTATRADDAGGHCPAEAIGIADGDDPVADARAARGSEMDGGQADAWDGRAAERCRSGVSRPTSVAGSGRPVRQDHAHALRTVDDVIIGDDEAGGIDDETGTQALHLAAARRRIRACRAPRRCAEIARSFCRSAGAAEPALRPSRRPRRSRQGRWSRRGLPGRPRPTGHCRRHPRMPALGARHIDHGGQQLGREIRKARGQRHARPREERSPEIRAAVAGNRARIRSVRLIQWTLDDVKEDCARASAGPQA